MKTPDVPFILLAGVLEPIDPRSLTDGTVVCTKRLVCSDCYEDLVDGPCRLGRVECYFCGMIYPLAATVPLRGEKAAGKVALVDFEDAEKALKFEWFIMQGHTNRTCYAATKQGIEGTGAVQRLLHHLVFPGHDMIDHIDGNGLNNCKKNLRPTDASSNQHNAALASHNTSGFKGVSWCKREQGWRASIRIQGVYHSLGYHQTPEKAAEAYDTAARLAFGGFACVNFPKQSERAARSAPPMPKSADLYDVLLAPVFERS